MTIIFRPDQSPDPEHLIEEQVDAVIEFITDQPSEENDLYLDVKSYVEWWSDDAY